MAASTRKTVTETQAESLFGTPIYARKSKNDDRHKKIMAGTVAAGLAVGAAGLLWATSAAQDNRTPIAASSSVTEVAALPSPAVLPAPVLTPAPMAVPEPVSMPRDPVATRTQSMAARTARTSEPAPSATDNTTDVSAREYAPVIPAQADVAPPSMTEQPPQAAPIPLIAEE